MVAVSGAAASPGLATPRLTGSGLLRSRVLQTAALILGVAAVTGGAYFLILGWAKRTDSGVDAYLSAPYHGWQIGLLVAVLAVLSLGTGWLGRPIVGSITLAAAITTCWACDAALNVPGDRNWPIGMTLVAWASFGGSLFLAGLVAEARQMVRRRAEEVREAALEAERAAERVRFAAEQAAAQRRAADEAARRDRELEAARVAAAARAEAARLEAEFNAARKAKVANALSAKVRATSTRVRSRRPAS